MIKDPKYKNLDINWFGKSPLFSSLVDIKTNMLTLEGKKIETVKSVLS